MNIIIDTHIYLWAISNPGQLKDHQRSELETLANTIYLSAISVSELMIKSSIAKLEINFDPVAIAHETWFSASVFLRRRCASIKKHAFPS